MTGMFSKPKSPKVAPQQKIEEVQKVEDDAASEQEREKKRLLQAQGKSSTLVAGIANALKTRLGE